MRDDDVMAVRMFLRCPACDHEFESGFQIDRASWESGAVEMSGSSSECPSCRLPVLTSKDTVFFKP